MLFVNSILTKRLTVAIFYISEKYQFMKGNFPLNWWRTALIRSVIFNTYIARRACITEWFSLSV